MKRFLAVDGNSIVNRAFYGVRPLSNKEGFPTNALFGMVGILEKNIELRVGIFLSYSLFFSISFLLFCFKFNEY